MHRILERQIKHFLGDKNKIPKELAELFDVINNTYIHFDEDRALLDRSLELSSKEFLENNALILKSKERVEEKVRERTHDLELANEKIKTKNKSLEDALNSKNDFIRIANHQLNTPLSIMTNAYDMMQDKSLTPKEAIEYWGSGLKRMMQVVEDFWNVFQSEGEIKYDIKENDIADAIKNAVENKNKVLLATKKSIEVTVDSDPNFLIPKVLCDIKKINNVIYNLLDNAIFYTKEGKIIINYSLDKNSNFLKISIKDNGIGFTKEDKEKMGQKFFRAKNAILAHPDGSGLGLYICKNIIEANGGKFNYESEGKDKGATFIFTLPIAK